MELNNEVWKDIKGYERLYQVSNLGRVRSLDRVVNDYLNGGTKIHKGRILKGGAVKGYLRVTLSRDGFRKGYSVHRLVAEAFIPNPENKTQVNHLNKNRSDNRVCNLEWATAKENSLHAYYNNSNYGDKTYHEGLLTEDQVKEVKRLYYIKGYKTPSLIKAVKDMYGVEITPHTVTLMDNFEIWKYIDMF